MSLATGARNLGCYQRPTGRLDPSIATFRTVRIAKIDFKVTLPK